MPARPIAPERAIGRASRGIVEAWCIPQNRVERRVPFLRLRDKATVRQPQEQVDDRGPGSEDLEVSFHDQSGKSAYGRRSTQWAIGRIRPSRTSDCARSLLEANRPVRVVRGHCSGIEEEAYNHSMPIFMCRWPNGDLSFVASRSREDAIVLLDEWGNAEEAELRRVQDFMVDFRLTDDGELELQAFGENSEDDIWNLAFPVLSKARVNLPTTKAGSLTPAGEEKIRTAVRAERQRLRGKKKEKPAETELGKSVQRQMGAPAALINRYVKRAATELLKKLPTTGRKQ